MLNPGFSSDLLVTEDLDAAMAMRPSIEEGRHWKKPFFTIWTGQAISLLGTQLVQFALVWHLTESTGSATVLASASLVALLPYIFVSPVAGALVDRWNRRVVMIVVDSLVVLATVVLAVLFALDVVQVWHIYVLMFVRSLGGAFHWPAMTASTSLMVPEEHLSRIGGMNQTLSGAMNIVSPPLGALLLRLLSVEEILMIDVITALPAIVLLLFIPIPQPVAVLGKETTDARPSVLDDLREGLCFVKSHMGFVMLLIVFMLSNLLVAPAYSLLPIVVTRHFGGDVLELAWLQAAMGIGTIVGGLMLSVWGGFRRRIVTSMMATSLLGVGLVVFGLSPGNALLLGIGALFFTAAMGSMTGGSNMAILQAAVPPEIQGRVFTLMVSGVSAMTPIGLMIAGPLSDAIGPQIWFVAGGFVTTAVGVGAFFVPSLMRIEDGISQTTTTTDPSSAVTEEV